MSKLYERVCAAEAFVAAAFLVFMVLLIFLGGVLRMLGHPINWSGDFATAFFAWACFLAADIAWRRNSLMSIRVLTERLPPAIQSGLRLLNYAIISTFLIYLIVMGAHLSWISRVRSFQGIPEISYSWVTMSLPVGGLLLLITTILKVRDEWRGGVAEDRSRDVV
ncbi:MAG: TRAP transporter small permease subunit [Alphaproteobacteria bacterium]|nr:TRAP transporter small permease subunit [Alphaproteobacteria bacterium]